MNESLLKIGVQGDKTRFSPGEPLSGAVLWELEKPPKSAELCLLWLSEGHGSEESVVVERVKFEAPQAGDTRPFSFVLPESPYSFEGKLFSISWALEFVIQPGSHFARVPLVMAPEGRAIRVD